MSFAETRGRVEKVDSYFTHVRVGTAMNLMLFNHKGEAAAPEELRKVGTEVFVYMADDLLFHVRAAPPKKVIPQRKAAPQPERGGNAPASEPQVQTGQSARQTAVAALPKIPTRRR